MFNNISLHPSVPNRRSCVLSSDGSFSALLFSLTYRSPISLPSSLISWFEILDATLGFLWKVSLRRVPTAGCLQIINPRILLCPNVCVYCYVQMYAWLVTGVRRLMSISSSISSDSNLLEELHMTHLHWMFWKLSFIYLSMES